MKRKPAKPRSAPKPAKAVASRKPGGKRSAIKPATKARDLFTQGLLQRGEAALARNGKHLPAGATHEIVESIASGQINVKRLRFSAH